MSGKYDHLDDPAEREWLTNVDPEQVLRNAHRIYDFIRESGLPEDSYTRELAFTKAAEALGVNYDVLYHAWLAERPITGDATKFQAQCARDAARSGYGGPSYHQYLEESALEKAEKWPARASYFMTRSLGDALAGNNGE